MFQETKQKELGKRPWTRGDECPQFSTLEVRNSSSSFGTAVRITAGKRTP